MVTYKVAGPDGANYNIDGPDGASDSEVFSVLQQHLASQYQPPTPTVGKTLLHGAERGVAPAAAGLAGFGAGAAAAAPLDPFTFGAASLVAGIGAGAVAAYGASKAQKKLLEAAPEVAKSIGQDPATQQAEEQAHPIAAQVGEALPQFAAFRPSLEVFKAGAAGAAARKMAVANSALGAGMDLGQQEIGDQPVDWKQVGVSAALGAGASKETKLGSKLVGLGRNIIPGTKPEGTITNEPTPEVQPETPTPTTDPRDLVLNHITGPETSTKKSISEATGLDPLEVTKQVNALKKEGLAEFDIDSKQWKAKAAPESAPEQMALPIEAPKPVPAEPVHVNDLAAGPQEPVVSPLEAPAQSQVVEQGSPISVPSENAIQPAAEPVASFTPESENVPHGEPADNSGVAAPELAANHVEPAAPAGGVEPAVARETPGIFTPEGSVSRGLDAPSPDVGGRDGGTEGKPTAVNPEQSDDELQAYWMRRQLEDKPQAVKRNRDVGLRFDDATTQPEDAWFKSGGMKKDDVQNLVNEYTKDWTNKPDIQVHQSTEDGSVEVPKTTKGGAIGDQVHLFSDNLNNPEQVKSTLFHEALGHYGLRQNFDQARTSTMRDIYNTNSRVRDMAQKWLDAYSDKPYVKDMSRNQQVAYATEEILAKSSEKGPIQDVGVKAAFNRVAAMIRNFGRRFTKINYSDNDVRQILAQAHERVISGKKTGMQEKAGTQLSNPATIKAPGVSTRSPDEIIHQIGKDATGKNYNDQYSKESILKGVTKAFTTKAGFERGIGLLQNYMRPIRNLQEGLRASKLLEYSGSRMNALYDLMSTSGAKAANRARELEPHIKELNTAISNYAKKSGIDVEKALKTVHAYAMALHEPERRHQKFIENVPLDNKTKLQIGKQSLTPADYRAEIMKKLYSSQDLVSTGLTKQLRTQLENLVAKYKDAGGYSPVKGSKAMSLNEDSAQYGVLGDYTKQELQGVRDALAHDPNNGEVQNILDATKKIQDKSAEFDRESNYRTQPVDNLIDFYNWKHYVPFKGNPKVSVHDDRFELQGKRVSGELNQYAEKAEGRDTDSTNPILQTVADAGKSAARVGRVGVTDAIKNLIEQGHIPGKLKQTVPFTDRYNGLTKEDIQGENKVFHYKPDGSIDVLSIKDPSMVHAIKGFNSDVGKFWKGLNTVNTAIGGLHTRYNPAFAPYNFVRHAMTSALIAGAEKGGFGGPMTTAKFLGTVASKVVDGGLWRAGRMATAIENKDNAKIAGLAGKHSFYQDLKDYIDVGGPVSYNKNFSIKSQQEELMGKVGPSRFLRTLDQVQKYFDIYNQTFELAGRAAGFGVVRDNIIARMKGEGADVTSSDAKKAINLQAAAYTKNLFNYEQVGKYGREAGALYMFLRPSLTTAVRSLDAIAPAFSDGKSRLASMPESIRSDPTAAQNFLKDQESKKTSARMLMAGMVGSGIALYHMALLGAEKDDQGRNKVADDDMALWTRNMRLPIGFAHGVIGKENDYLQLPWGFGLGSFGAFGAQLAGVVEGHNTLASAFSNMIPIALDSYMPLPVPKFNPVDHPIAFVVESIVPSFARPFIEYGMNVDDFGRQVYNDRSSAFGDAYTGGEHIPEAYSAATKALADSTNGSINISPSTLHFFANSYFDGLSRIAHDSYGISLLAGGKKEFDAKRDIPVLDSFIGKSNSYDAREFSDVSKEVAKQQAILQMYKSNPDQLANYVDKHPNAQMVVNIYNTQVNGMLKQVSHQIGLIQSNPDMSGKEKSELLKELHDQQDWIKRNIIDTVKDYN